MTEPTPERFAFTIEITAASKEEAESALSIIAQLGKPFGMTCLNDQAKEES